MENDRLYFSVKDTIDGVQVTPENVPLKLIIELADAMNRFIYGKAKSTGEVSVSIKKGSFAIVAPASPVTQSAISDYRIVKKTGVLDNIDPIRARIIRDLQIKAQKDENRIYTISDKEHINIDNRYDELVISKETDYKTIRTDQWVLTETYMYGMIVDIGGKTKTNVHLVLENGDTIVLNADSKQIEKDEINRVYRKQLIRVMAEQNLETKKYRNERLLDFVEYDPKFDEKRFNEISKKVRNSWADVPDVLAWIENVRGNYAQKV